MELNVYIEKNSEKIFCGIISGGKFSYAKGYLQNENSRAISISLPLQENEFDENKTKAFFDGLLPEGFSRRSLASHMQLPENDYLGILSKLGTECIGAIQIIGNDEPQKAEYKRISLEEVKALAAEGASKSTELLIQSHLSLAGASGKVGLYYDERNDAWYQPFGVAPSTHIVKQSHVRLSGIVINELLCQWTARECGIETSDSFILPAGGSGDSGILFATKRYDRALSNENYTSGLPCPDRLHQEDFAQALATDSFYKYEPAGGAYLKKCFELLQNNSANPLADSLKLWNIVLFNYLIGNTDAHLKNFSLMYNQNIEQPLLAPAYDLISTAIYEGSTRKLSMRIGDATDLDQVCKESFRLAAKEIKLNERLAMACYERMMDLVPAALEKCADQICELGFEQAGVIKDKILKQIKRGS